MYYRVTRNFDPQNPIGQLHLHDDVEIPATAEFKMEYTVVEFEADGITAKTIQLHSLSLVEFPALPKPIQPTCYRISNTDHPYFNKRVELLRINGENDTTPLHDDAFCQVRVLGTDTLVWLWAFELRVLEDVEVNVL